MEDHISPSEIQDIFVKISQELALVILSESVLTLYVPVKHK